MPVDVASVAWSDECNRYWAEVEEPHRIRMRSMIGKIYRTTDNTPEFSDEDGDIYFLPPGTYVRIVDWTPSHRGHSGGNYFNLETLDGRLFTSQVYLYEFEELNALDRLALLDDQSSSEDPSS